MVKQQTLFYVNNNITYIISRKIKINCKNAFFINIDNQSELYFVYLLSIAD